MSKKQESLRCLLLIYEFTYIRFFESGHRMSKHVDGSNNNRWDNWTLFLFYNINTITVASENDNRMLH